MNWTDRTFWLTDPATGILAHALVVEEGAERILYSGETGFDFTRVGEHAPCATCPHASACMSSRWADSKRMGGPTAPAPLSLVFRCQTCGDMVLLMQGSTGVVSQSCPRQGPETSVNCPDCDDPNSLIEAQWVVGRLMNDAEIRFPSLANLPQQERDGLLSNGIKLIQQTLQVDPTDYAGMVSVFTTEVLHAATYQSNRTSAEQRFTQRIWEGVVKQTLVGLRHSVEGNPNW